MGLIASPKRKERDKVMNPYFKGDDFICPDCGFEGEPIVETVTEGTDRDGRRGIDVVYAECPECGYTEAV